MLTHGTPNIVVSNYIAQVKRQPGISWTESRECAPYFAQRQQPMQRKDHTLSNQSFLDFVTGNTY